MKKSSKKKIQEINASVIKKNQLKKVKGGNQEIVIEDLNDF